jgi:CRISPR-associated helicase Cas3/CRISPR-associated endonuclease Cas3-HD
VAELAEEFAKSYAPEEAVLAGLLHDLGKYGELFQKRLRGEGSGIDHWSIGAWRALQNDIRAAAAALAIQGHHTGLLKGDKDSFRNIDPKRLSMNPEITLSCDDLNWLDERLKEDGIYLKPPAAPIKAHKTETPASTMVDVRMLFSALVDADFLDTSRHFYTERKAGLFLEPKKAFQILEEDIRNRSQNKSSSKELSELRSDLWKASLEAAAEDMGIKTLSAPTGSGKTLAMLGFALQHAIKHNLKRIIFVIPYLSIADQTVSIYRELFRNHFPDEYVLEHTSLANMSQNTTAGITDMEKDLARRQEELTENWDAPIVVTTSVQFLESLFSNRSSACRKLHNIAESVVLFDEVQTLPMHLVIPILAALSRLAEHYRTTIVFSTATQPAFTHLDEKVKETGCSGWKSTEIVPKELNLFDRSKRVEFHWPKKDEKLNWEILSNKMINDEQSLTIVNLKRHAISLIKALQEQGSENIYHISTSMCPAHRVDILKEIKEHLNKNLPCHVVSTQCIEAGVDIDFPVVYRAMGPLDSIAQAAGRCNREGKKNHGDVFIFNPEEDGVLYPPGGYEKAAQATKILLYFRKTKMDIDDPELFNKYYQCLYSLSKPEKLKEDLKEAIETQNYQKAAQEFGLIENSTIRVLVPYKKNLQEYERLIANVREKGISREWIRTATPYTINIFLPNAKSPTWGYLENVHLKDKSPTKEWFIYLEEKHYDDLLGLQPPSMNEVLIG